MYDSKGYALCMPCSLSFSLALVICFFLSTPRLAEASGPKNLIVDGGGEDGTCSDDITAVTTVPGWTVTKGSPNILCYPDRIHSVPKQQAQGRAFFSGGPYGDSTLIQMVDISSAHSNVDTGVARFFFDGWFGGAETNPGRSIATLRFLKENGQSVGSPIATSPITAGIRAGRTGLLEQRIGGYVPAGTRTIAVSIEFIGTEVDSGADLKKATAINTGSADNLSLHLSIPVRPASLKPPASSVPAFDHVFLIMMENTTYGDLMTHLQDTPFISSLLAQGAQITNMAAINHPSDQNYLAIAGGATFVKGGVYFPDISVHSEHIGDRIESIGKTWKGYEQGMGAPCGTTNQYDRYFEADDLPFINFTNIRMDPARCRAHLVDANELYIDLKATTTTPDFSWIAADDYCDGEQAYNQGGLKLSLQVQDQWLRETITTITGSPAWQTQRSLLVVTWDESYYPFTQNQIPTIILGSRGLVRAGYQSIDRANLYSVARTLEEALGISPLTANDKYAQPLNDVFSEQKVR